MFLMEKNNNTIFKLTIFYWNHSKLSRFAMWRTYDVTGWFKNVK